MALPKIEKRIRANTPVVGTPPFGQVHAHSTGNPSSTAEGEASFMQTKNLSSGFYTHVVGNGRIIQVAPVNRGAWDVGGDWNAWSYASVELIESHKTKAEFMKDYKIYVELLRKLAKDGGVKIKVDSGELGILTHNYCTYHQPNSKSDHVDPIPYLAKWGISRAQFKKDVENGTTSGGGTTDKWAKQYYTKAPGKVQLKTDIGVYGGNDVEFNKKLSSRKKGTIVTTKGVKHAKNGCPRLVTTKGNLITANKKYVKDFKWSTNYYSTAPKKVKLKKNVGVFAKDDVELSKKLGYRKAGTIIPIKGIKKSKKGRPNLLTTGDKLITAKRSYVKAVEAGIPSKGTFVNGDTSIQVRRGAAGLNATKAGKLPAKAKVKYDATVKKDGYTWIKYVGSSGSTLYCPVAKGSTKYGTFK